MASSSEIDQARRDARLRLAGWGLAAFILLLPFIAMRFTSEVDWSPSDFVVMGVMLGTAGLAMELVMRRSGDMTYRFAAGLAVATCFLLLWVNGAVGFLGDEGNPANLMFLGVIAVPMAGAVFRGTRPSAMSRTMLATVAAQVAVGVVGLAAGWASPGPDGVYEVVMGTGLFATLWLASAALFHRAARAWPA